MNAHIVKRVLIAACALAVVAVAAAPAYADIKAQRMPLAIDITGIQVHDWDYKHELTHGTGTQTLGFSTPKPVRYLAYSQQGSAMGKKIDLFGIAHVHRPRPLRGSLRRSHKWNIASGPMACEGGQQYCRDGGPPPALKFKCPPLRPKLTYSISSGQIGNDMNGLFVSVTVPPRPWAFCPPDHLGHDLLEDNPVEARWTARESVARIRRLKPNGRLTLKWDSDVAADGGRLLGRKCRRSDFAGPGFKQCVTTNITVKIRRVG